MDWGRSSSIGQVGRTDWEGSLSIGQVGRKELLVDPKDFYLEAVEVLFVGTELFGNRIGRDGGFLIDALADFVFQHLSVLLRNGFEMLVLAVVMQKVEVQEIVRLGDLANNDVVAVVDVFRGTDFNHLDVTERTVG